MQALHARGSSLLLPTPPAAVPVCRQPHRALRRHRVLQASAHGEPAPTRDHTYAPALPTIKPATQQETEHARAAAPCSADTCFTMMSTITLGLVGALALALPEASHAAQSAQDAAAPLQHQYDLAGAEDFWVNVSRYARFFVTVLLGTGYVMLRPLAGAFKNPFTGALATVGVIGGVFLLKFTLELMLGVTDAGDLSFEYVQGNF